MKAISLWQPFASLIADGRKPYETRHWAPPAALIGQRIAIHAARRWTREEKEAACDLYYYAYFYGAGGRANPPAMPLGAVVCTARLVAAHRVGKHGPLGTVAISDSGSLARDGDPWYDPVSRYFPIDAYGDYSPGRWAWRLVDVEALDPPVPARGRQGFWTWER